MCHFLHLLLKGIFLLLILLCQTGPLHARPAEAEVPNLCPSIDVPDRQPVGRNVIHDHKPLFRLDVSSVASVGYIPGTAYTFYLHAQDPSHKFIDAALSTSAEDPFCSNGRFVSDNVIYRQEPNCLHVVSKRKKTKENRFAFNWVAPSCGCVVIRALVKSEDRIYYMDNTQNGGHLTKRICPQRISTILSQMNQGERIDLLCKVMNNTALTQLSVGAEFLRRRNIKSHELSYLARDSLQIHLENRVFQIKQCCSQIGTARIDCISDIRRHRIDHLCSHEQPDIPFTAERHSYMMERRDECCWRLGERRYRCFSLSRGNNEGRYYSPEALRDRSNEIFVYSDESDPVNDLEDFRAALNQEVSTTGQISHEPLITKTNVITEQPTVITGLLSAEPITEPASAHVKETSQEVVRQQDPVEQNKAPKVARQEITKETTRPPTSKPVVYVTETMKELEEKVKRVTVKHDCCYHGKGYYVEGQFTDAWGSCERGARDYIHSVERLPRKFRSRCRSFFQRCCMEQYQSIVQQLVHSSETEEESDALEHAQRPRSRRPSSQESAIVEMTGERYTYTSRPSTIPEDSSDVLPPGFPDSQMSGTAASFDSNTTQPGDIEDGTADGDYVDDNNEDDDGDDDDDDDDDDDGNYNEEYSIGNDSDNSEGMNETITLVDEVTETHTSLSGDSIEPSTVKSTTVSTASSQGLSITSAVPNQTTDTRNSSADSSMSNKDSEFKGEVSIAGKSRASGERQKQRKNRRRHRKSRRKNRRRQRGRRT